MLNKAHIGIYFDMSFFIFRGFIVESEVGKGTTFHVFLPTVEEKILPPMLEKLGYKVTARTSSIEALEAFRHKPQAFDIVITDMTMPNMTGSELAKEVMTIRPDMPIILCTGFSEQIDDRRAKEIGIRAFVMKPIVMHDMTTTVREVLDKK